MKSKMVRLEFEAFEVYVSDEVIIKRGVDGRWELMDITSFKLIDSDRYRNDLAERNNLNLSCEIVSIY